MTSGVIMLYVASAIMIVIGLAAMEANRQRIQEEKDKSKAEDSSRPA
ncbi:hypothetical protein [uncultured Cardiobacterium sp.]|nr:hypothetical protein [uncultured Cardiobacterium sp.]